MQVRVSLVSSFFCHLTYISFRGERERSVRARTRAYHLVVLYSKLNLSGIDQTRLSEDSIVK